jgi:hypothetical protein
VTLFWGQFSWRQIVVNDVPYVGSNIIIRVFNADNNAFVYLNGNLVVNHSTEGDPSFQADFPFSLKQGENNIAIWSINWGGPSHIRYALIVDNDTKDVVDEKAYSTSNGIWYSKTYRAFNIS